VKTRERICRILPRTCRYIAAESNVGTAMPPTLHGPDQRNSRVRTLLEKKLPVRPCCLVASRDPTWRHPNCSSIFQETRFAIATSHFLSLRDSESERRFDLWTSKREIVL
jgi:hypothetical protein